MISNRNAYNVLDQKQLALFYLTAKEKVIEAGYASEIDWQEDVSLDSLDESTFLREAAWVILSSGFRESILRRCFQRISIAFLNWSSAEEIIARQESCRSQALKCFNNIKKINAIVKIANRVSEEGIDNIRDEIRNRGIDYIQEYPFMGPVTSRHLAKNIGVLIAKPDRHLGKIAACYGYDSVDEMCCLISEIVGDTIPVIDVVIWRYATITKNYEKNLRLLVSI
ncbi:hypothetical protein ACFL54_04135 [Planctomycetota bacterium]